MIYNVLKFLLFVVVFADATDARAELLNNISFDDRWPTVTERALVLDTNRSLLMMGRGDVVSVYNTDTLVEKGRLHLDLTEDIQGLAYDASSYMLYVAATDGGVCGIDLTDSTAPVLRFQYALTDSSDDVYGSAVAVKDNRVYLADVFYGLWILDVTNPDLPVLLEKYPQYSTYETEDDDEETEAVSGGYIGIELTTVDDVLYAVMLDMYYGMRLLDVSDYSAVIQVGKYDMRSSEYYGQLSNVVDVIADGSRVYITDVDNGVTVVDLFDTTESPATVSIDKVGQYETPGTAVQVVLANGLTWVADGSNGLEIVNFSTPATPVVVGNYAVTGAYAIAVSGNDGFLANMENGLVKLQLDDPSNPIGGSIGATPADTETVVTSDEFVFIGDGDGPNEGVRIITLSDSSEYRLSKFVATPGSVKGLQLVLPYLYVADGSAGLTLINIDDAESAGISNTVAITDCTAVHVPEQSGLTGSTVDDEVQWGYGGGISDDQGIFIMDLTDPASPVVLSWIDASQIADPKDIFFYPMSDSDWDGTTPPHMYACVTSSSGVHIVDLENPDQPEIRGNVSIKETAQGVYVSGTIAAVAAGERGLYVIDVSDPDVPVIENTVSISGSPVNVFIDGSYVHIAASDAGIRVYGIASDLDYRMDEITYRDTPGNAVDVCVAESGSDRYTYVADGCGGLVICIHDDESSTDGISEQPFADSPDDTGMPECFVSSCLW